MFHLFFEVNAGLLSCEYSCVKFMQIDYCIVWFYVWCFVWWGGYVVEFFCEQSDSVLSHLLGFYVSIRLVMDFIDYRLGLGVLGGGLCSV